MSIKLIPIEDLAKEYFKNNKLNWKIDKVIDAYGNSLPEHKEILIVIKPEDKTNV